MISERSEVPIVIIYKVFRVMRDITAERIKNNEDSLIPGIMRIGPGEGGLTRRYVKIKSVSRYLKEELK
jgi:hypothetical protein